MELQTHGARKYPTSTLLGSSAGLGWSTIAAELRSHGVSETPLIAPQHTELCLAIAGNENGLVRRTGAGQYQQAVPRTGTIWLSPMGISDNEVAITAPISRALHLYLPAMLFDRLKDDFNLPTAPAHSIRYLAAISDEVIWQLGRSILSELTNETAASRLYVETASLALGAKLLQKYCDSGTCVATESSAHGLDHSRLAASWTISQQTYPMKSRLKASLQSRVTARSISHASSHSLWGSRRVAISATNAWRMRWWNWQRASCRWRR